MAGLPGTVQQWLPTRHALTTGA